MPLKISHKIKNKHGKNQKEIVLLSIWLVLLLLLSVIFLRCFALCIFFKFEYFFYLHQSGGCSICSINNRAVIQRTVASGRFGDIKFFIIVVVVMIEFTLCIDYFVFAAEFRRLRHIFWSCQIYWMRLWWFNGVLLVLMMMMMILLLTLLFNSIRCDRNICARYLYQNRTNFFFCEKTTVINLP